MRGCDTVSARHASVCAKHSQPALARVMAPQQQQHHHLPSSVRRSTATQQSAVLAQMRATQARVLCVCQRQARSCGCAVVICAAARGAVQRCQGGAAQCVVWRAAPSRCFVRDAEHQLVVARIRCLPQSGQPLGAQQWHWLDEMAWWLDDAAATFKQPVPVYMYVFASHPCEGGWPVATSPRAQLSLQQRSTIAGSFRPSSRLPCGTDV